MFKIMPKTLFSLSSAVNAFIFIFIVVLLSGPVLSGSEKPKNLIFFIGDGMGVSALTLASMVSVAQGNELAILKMPVSGLSHTFSSDMTVTDSAAAGTALATGFKTKNHMLSVNDKGENIKSILEAAKEKGYLAGVVTTTYVAHATPGAFAAHSKDRNSTNDIALEMFNSDLEVIFGGGTKHFKMPAKPSKYSPKVDILSLAPQKGYSIALNREELMALPGHTKKAIGLFTYSHMSYEIDRDPALEPSIKDMTQKAIQILSNKDKPFFLMVEGGKIDHAAHGHDAPALIKDLQAFDQAVAHALEFCEKDNETLVVVTADHETAGLTILERVDLAGFARVKSSVEKAGDLIRKNKLDPEKAKTEYFPFAGIDSADLKANSSKSLGYNTFMGFGDLISNYLGVTFISAEEQIKSKSTFGHTGSMVPVFAQGPGAAAFTGAYDNTRIPRKMAALLGLNLDSGPEEYKVPLTKPGE